MTTLFEPTDDYAKALAFGDKYRFGDKETESTSGIEEQFVPISFRRINDPVWRKKHRSAFTGYVYIRSQVVRGIYSGDKYDLYNRYYKDNKFAAGPSFRHLSEAFGYKDENTKPVRNWVKQLYAEGAFIIDKIDVGKPEPANIYVLGYNEQGKHVFYYDIV